MPREAAFPGRIVSEARFVLRYVGEFSLEQFLAGPFRYRCVSIP